MKRSVYLETSIISYYTARPSRDLVITARQEITHEMWPILQANFDVYISALVLQEASRGDKEASGKRLNVVSGIPVLELTDQTLALANSLISFGAIPVTAKEDALHIAVASLHGVEFLLTWNFSHINNAFKKSKIVKTIEAQGLIPPEKRYVHPKSLLGIEMKDCIVEEAREAHAEEFGHDLVSICRDLKRIEKECGHQVVSRLPRLLTKASSQRDVVAMIENQAIVFGEIDR